MFLPTLNAALNLTAVTLLVLGVRAIRRGDESRHKRLMCSALGVSAAFLVSYVTHHLTSEPTRFQGEGVARGVYLAVLLSHTVLAACVPFMALRTAWLGWKDRRASHRKWARITYPIWLYVSVTGVLIYLVLYPFQDAVG
jgi:putative membrane protein